MNQNQVIKLPFWEIVKRSFLYPLVNVKTVLKVSAIWFLLLIYEIANGYPGICNFTDQCYNPLADNISLLLLSFASVSIAVAFSRNVILKVVPDRIKFSFGKREWKYLGYNLLILLMVFIPSIILLLMIELLGLQGTSGLIGLIALVITIICARFYLVLPATAVNNSQITLKEAFRLMKGNANKIFWGQILLMLPIAFVLFLIALIYVSLNTNAFVVKLIFSAIVMFLSFFDTCVKACFYSHIYQYVMYTQKNGGKKAASAVKKEVLPKEEPLPSEVKAAEKKKAPVKKTAAAKSSPKKTVKADVKKTVKKAVKKTTEKKTPTKKKAASE